MKELFRVSPAIARMGCECIKIDYSVWYREYGYSYEINTDCGTILRRIINIKLHEIIYVIKINYGISNPKCPYTIIECCDLSKNDIVCWNKRLDYAKDISGTNPDEILRWVRMIENFQ
jgi:hypothetical protein